MQTFSFQHLSTATCGILAMLIGSTVFGQGLQQQNPYASRLQQQTIAPTPAMKYFGGGLTKPAPTQKRQNVPLPQPVQVTGAKPFQNLQRGATLSPYLGLDLRTSDSSIPNYHAFVRPRQQQQLANKAQAAHIRRLKQRLRVATTQGIVSNNPSGGVPTTGHSSQFLNMGGYFPPPR